MPKVFTLLTTLVTVLAATAVGTGNASAASDNFGCRIAPGSEFNFYNYCYPTRGPNAYGQYSIAYKLQNPPSGATYSWVIPSAYQSRIVSGCASISSTCTIWSYPTEDTIEVLGFCWSAWQRFSDVHSVGRSRLRCGVIANLTLPG